MTNLKTRPKGFTLIELLIVISVLGILATVVFVALDPLKRFQDSRNSRRWTDVNSVLSAIKLYQVDKGGYYPDSMTAMTDNTYYQIGQAGTGCDTTCGYPDLALQGACVDLSALIDKGYLAEIPKDPYSGNNASDQKTGYYVYKYNTGQISIGSCFEEQGSADAVKPIEVSR